LLSLYAQHAFTEAGLGAPDVAASRSPALLSGREPLLEGCILSLPGPINQKPAEQPRARPGGGPETSVPADRANYRAAAGADSRAGQRALLGWGHIGTSDDRQSDGREQQ
jgi:hypothetical protein